MSRSYRWYEALGIYVGIGMLLVFMLAPFIEAARVSLSPMEHLLAAPYRLLPENFSFAAYGEMWRGVPLLGTYIANSLIISGSCAAIVLMLAVPAAYVMARLRFRGRDLIGAGLLAVNMFGGAVLLVPFYRMLRQAGLLNTYGGIIVPGAALLLPTAVWLLLPAMRAIPRELEQAAAIDGASRAVILVRIVLPLAAPGLLVTGATVFIGAYAQQFLIALAFNSRQSIMPISVGLFQFFGRNEVLWNQLMAASFVSILPVVVLFALLHGRIVRGLMAGGVTG